MPDGLEFGLLRRGDDAVAVEAGNTVAWEDGTELVTLEDSFEQLFLEPLAAFAVAPAGAGRSLPYGPAYRYEAGAWTLPLERSFDLAPLHVLDCLALGGCYPTDEVCRPCGEPEPPSPPIAPDAPRLDGVDQWTFDDCADRLVVGTGCQPPADRPACNTNTIVATDTDLNDAIAPGAVIELTSGVEYGLSRTVSDVTLCGGPGVRPVVSTTTQTVFRRVIVQGLVLDGPVFADSTTISHVEIRDGLHVRGPVVATDLRVTGLTREAIVVNDGGRLQGRDLEVRSEAHDALFVVDGTVDVDGIAASSSTNHALFAFGSDVEIQRALLSSTSTFAVFAETSTVRIQQANLRADFGAVHTNRSDVRLSVIDMDSVFAVEGTFEIADVLAREGAFPFGATVHLFGVSNVAIRRVKVAGCGAGCVRADDIRGAALEDVDVEGQAGPERIAAISVTNGQAAPVTLERVRISGGGDVGLNLHTTQVPVLRDIEVADCKRGGVRTNAQTADVLAVERMSVSSVGGFGFLADDNGVTRFSVTDLQISNTMGVTGCGGVPCAGTAFFHGGVQGGMSPVELRRFRFEDISSDGVDVLEGGVVADGVIRGVDGRGVVIHSPGHVAPLLRNVHIDSATVKDPVSCVVEQGVLCGR